MCHLDPLFLAVSVTEDYKEKGATLGVVVWFLVVLVQSGFFVGCHHCIKRGGGGILGVEQRHLRPRFRVCF
jgi:uncharacterized YccA/Bax inhibitor family protein